MIAAFLNQKLDGGDDLLAFLYFVQKDQRFSRNQRNIGYRRQPQQEIFTVSGVFKQRLGRFVLIEVDFNKGFILLAKFADDKGFANLTCAGNQQSLFFTRITKAL